MRRLLSEIQEFSRETPYILKGRIPTEKIRDGLERIYNAKGNTYEAAVAMTGEMYSLLAVFMHYAEHEEKEKAIQLTYAEKAESYIETNYSYPITVEEIASYVGISRSHLFRSFTKLYEQIAERIFDGIQDQAGVSTSARDRSFGLGDCLFGRF